MSTPRDPARLIERARAARGDSVVARRALGLLDLDARNLDGASLRALCARTIRYGCAAVVVAPGRIAVARDALARSGVRLATVANLPEAGDDIAGIADRVAAAVAEGAREIEIGAPAAALDEGDIELVGELIEACRTAAGPDARLSLVLDSARLGRPDRITACARAAVMSGIDALVSRFERPAGTDALEAAAVVLAVIEEAGGRVGVKASGAIATTADVAAHLHLADELLGPAWARPATFRIGGTGMFEVLLASCAPGPEAP